MQSAPAIELALTPSWAARFEYLYTDYGLRGVTFPDAAQRFDSDLAVQALRLGLDYRFGSDSIDPDLFTKGPAALDMGWFVVHGQTTFIEQYAAPFRAPYSGVNSLAPNAGRETWDATLAAGFKLWQGAELWIDPEIDQGFGLSNTEGIAGFPSGAAFKVGASVPYPRIQRTFIRQTIDLGGETEKVDADFNQFAGSHTADRLVITIGKFSVSDVFDTNKYAQNPRNDFMNWALIDAGTFDYAADAWGYTYGAAAEWYQGSWTLRGGLFDLSIVPNSTELDPTFAAIPMDRRNRAPLRFVGTSRQDRRHRLTQPRPHGQLRGCDRIGRDHRRPGRYRRGARISEPRRRRHEPRAGNHIRSRCLHARRLGRRQHRAV